MAFDLLSNESGIREIALSASDLLGGNRVSIRKLALALFSHGVAASGDSPNADMEFS